MIQLAQLLLPLMLWGLYRSRLNLPGFFYNARFPAFVAAAFAGLAMLRVGRYAQAMLPRVEGWEADAIARSIAGGHGFSFPGNGRWLWDMRSGNPDEFFPTAWADPIYTYLLAGARMLFGDNAFAAAYVFSALLLVVIFCVVYRIASRFGGSWAGATAVILLAAHVEFPISFFADINSTGLASCVLTGLVLITIRYFEVSSRARLIVLGLYTGLTVLIWPAALYFAYALVFAIAFHHRAALRTAVLRPAAVLALAALVIAPWTIRNYVTFGEYVMVRNGAGEMAYAGTVAAGTTFLPQTAPSSAPAPWTASGPVEAIRAIFADREKRIAIEYYVFDSMAGAPPAGYEQMNEAQRDKEYFARAKNFLREYPLIATQMGFAKMESYLTKFGLYGLVLFGLAIGGALLAIKDERSWAATLVVATYTPLFVLIMPYFDRYRSPVEPSVVVLATIALVAADSWLVRALGWKKGALS